MVAADAVVAGGVAVDWLLLLVVVVVVAELLVVVALVSLPFGWVELAAAISSLTHRRLCRFDVSSLMH
uniref:Uncharacterized protein n=1 Tax=Anopheles darlingi TaxID=43151 RepID=A0A2M4DGS8_ANODA